MGGQRCQYCGLEFRHDDPEDEIGRPFHSWERCIARLLEEIERWRNGAKGARGVLAGKDHGSRRRATRLLEALANGGHVCGSGFPGCRGGRFCTSSHK